MGRTVSESFACSWDRPTGLPYPSLMGNSCLVLYLVVPWSADIPKRSFFSFMRGEGWEAGQGEEIWERGEVGGNGKERKLWFGMYCVRE